MSDSRWYTPEARELFRAVLTLETVDECARFMRDLLTEDELAECSARWRAVQLLDRGLSYREVSKLTGLSTATVTRVAKWWQRGMGGYGFVLERTKRRSRLKPAERKDSENGAHQESNGIEANGSHEAAEPLPQPLSVEPRLAARARAKRGAAAGITIEPGKPLQRTPLASIIPENETVPREDGDGTLERIRPFARKQRMNGKGPVPLV